jgi:hypothetical protein
MKALRTLLSIALFGSLIAFSGCGGKGGNSEPLSDKQLGLLSKTWKVKSVLLGSVDSTTHWTNFTLTIAGTKGQTTFTYTCADRPPRSVWPASGTWSFGTDPATQIIRDPNPNDPTQYSAQITYSVDAASQNLTLSFQYNGTGYTRVSNVTGAWTFNLIPG